MRLKSDSQEGIFGACFESCRPMRVRNVAALGTKGVGCGIGGGVREVWSERAGWRERLWVERESGSLGDRIIIGEMERGGVRRKARGENELDGCLSWSKSIMRANAKLLEK